MMSSRRFRSGFWRGVYIKDLMGHLVNIPVRESDEFAILKVILLPVRRLPLHYRRRGFNEMIFQCSA